MATANGVGDDELRSGACRERAEEGTGSRGREGGLDGSGRLRGVFRGVGAQAGSLEVARRAPGTQLLRCEGRKTTGGVAVAGWAVLLGQVGYQVSAR